jgi:hypothetical protein
VLRSILGVCSVNTIDKKKLSVSLCVFRAPFSEKKGEEDDDGGD